MGMITAYEYSVVPDLPEELRPLLRIAHNLWWTWNPDAVALFHRIDPEVWEGNHNPVKMLGGLKPRRIRELRKSNRLDGLKIKDLVEEGRRV